ncbi:MAG: PEP-CTERM sorting domain-containing protein [Cyanobacteria bacterium]|nr:PEP-CTERM sorting domain-containing protein [Cyanobacteriota bacterium]
MTFTRNLVSIAVLSAATVLGQMGSAQAFSFNMTKGIAGPNGVTDQGAYSDFSGKSTVKTIDFNSGVLPTTGFAKYSFVGSGSSSVLSDKWAPAGANGEVNNSKYLAVFEGKSVQIKLDSTANYFGIGLGAISSGNTLSFYRGTTLIKTYNTADMNDRATLSASQHGGEKNGYGHFYAGESERFDRVLISQADGDSGGFETDNHSFNIGKQDVRKTPEPGMMLGLVAIGGSVWAKRKQRG